MFAIALTLHLNYSEEVFKCLFSRTNTSIIKACMFVPYVPYRNKANLIPHLVHFGKISFTGDTKHGVLILLLN